MDDLSVKGACASSCQVQRTCASLSRERLVDDRPPSEESRQAAKQREAYLGRGLVVAKV